MFSIASFSKLKMKNLTIILLILPFVGFSQKKLDDDQVFLKRINTTRNQENDSLYFNQEDRSLANRSFIFYKKFISSQDIDACVFVPSCSEYALQAIHKHGKLKGGIMTFDRLLRCNGSNNKPYELDKNTQKFIDYP